MVEDNEDLRELLTEILSGLGCRVRAVGDDPAALAALKGGPGVDLLVTDVMLPGTMNDFAVARRLQAAGAGSLILGRLLIHSVSSNNRSESGSWMHSCYGPGLSSG